MPKNPSNPTKEELLNRLQELATIDSYLPLFHGTSKTNAQKIQQNGLKPRALTGGSSSWQISSSSLKDRVYFDICDDDLVERAAGNALRNESEKSYFFCDKTCLEEGGAFFELKNPQKYTPKMIQDEDAKNLDNQFIHSIYNDDSVVPARKSLSFESRPFNTPWVDPRITTLLDKLWITCGSKCVKEGTDLIPDYLKSIYKIRTFAIQDQIPAEDLTQLSYTEWKKRACKRKTDWTLYENQKYKLKAEYSYVLFDLEFNANTPEKVQKYTEKGKQIKSELTKLIESEPLP